MFDDVRISPNYKSIKPLGVGTWAWDNDFYWSLGFKSSDPDELEVVFEYCLNKGIELFDTAEVYGRGKSERILGRLIDQGRSQLMIATKYFPYPWRREQAFHRAVKGSLKRLGIESIDLYQIHWPSTKISIINWMNFMADAVELGLIKSVGVSNFNRLQTFLAYETLEKRGIKLASNQVLFNLIDRKAEDSGLIALCHALGINVIAYSPLAQGLLTGKYGPGKPLPGIRGIRTQNIDFLRLRDLLDTLQRISSKYGRTPAQTALNWTLCKDTIPIPGIRSMQQAQDNLQTLEWKLSADDLAELDRASKAFTTL